MSDKANLIWVSIIFVLSLYFGISWAIFEARNPLCNEIAFFTHFEEVFTYQRVDGFQLRD